MKPTYPRGSNAFDKDNEPTKEKEEGEDEEEEDDYMNMNFEDPTPVKETSLQRTQRLKSESKARGIIKSKAQIAEEEAAAREKALTTSMLDDPRTKKSKGFAMMAKMGFSGGGLGKKAEDGEGGGGGTGRTEPIHVSVKEDKGGIGMDADKKRKLQEAAEERGIKAAKIDPDEYRERVRREREDARLEKQFHAAQRMAERLDDESDPALSTRPLKSIPLLYRGLVRRRAERERDQQMRHDLEQSLSRLPTYEDDHEDADDKRALGKDKTVFASRDDLDEEDEELDEFDALEISERLRRALEYLRTHHQYCFWCKAAYPDSEMDGCPGFTEEEHD